MARSSSSDGGGYFFEVGFDEEVTDPLTMEHGHHLGFGALRKGIAQQARTGRSMTNASNDPPAHLPRPGAGADAQRVRLLSALSLSGMGPGRIPRQC